MKKYILITFLSLFIVPGAYVMFTFFITPLFCVGFPYMWIMNQDNEDIDKEQIFLFLISVICLVSFTYLLSYIGS